MWEHIHPATLSLSGPPEHVGTWGLIFYPLLADKLTLFKLGGGKFSYTKIFNIPALLPMTKASGLRTIW